MPRRLYPIQGGPGSSIVRLPAAATVGTTLYGGMGYDAGCEALAGGIHRAVRFAIGETCYAGPGIFGSTNWKVVPSGGRLTKSTRPPKYRSPSSFML